MFLLILLFVLLVTYGLWYVFERNTEDVRRIVGRTLARERVGALR
jgi:CHASE1-domain containing sensor protein